MKVDWSDLLAELADMRSDLADAHRQTEDLDQRLDIVFASHCLTEAMKAIGNLARQQQKEDSMEKTVRAKLRVHFAKPFGTPGFPQPGGEVVMSPVYSEDPNHENKKFWDATPSGEIRLFINNQAAFEFYEVNKEYYVDFTLAPAAEATRS